MTPDEIVAFRTQLGLTQTELASLLGVAQNTISRWEKRAISIEPPRSVWLDQEMARIARDHKRPRGRPKRRRHRMPDGAPRPAPATEGT